MTVQPSISSLRPALGVRPAQRALSSAAADRLKSRLEAALGPSKVVSEPEQLAAFAGDESENAPVLPDVAVLAASADDVAAILKIALEERAPVTPRAGGSGKSGGSIPIQGGIVLATSGMATIEEIDREELIAVVGPGLVLGDLHAAVEAEGLFYPPDANSLSWCALGGNIAENAGGPRAFKYGVTRDYVIGLDVALMGGERLTLGRRTKKGVTGYDMVGMVVGSEGTLAVTTRAVVRLLPKPEHVITMMALFDDVHGSGRAVQAMLAARVVPRCIELLDPATLAAVRKQGVAVDEAAGSMLIVEVDGTEDAASAEAERVGAACDESGARAVLVAQNEAQRDRLWAARRSLSPTTRAMAKYKVSEDVVVPRRHIGALLAEVDRIRESSTISMLTYGHAGDGNLHVNYLWNDPSQEPEVAAGLERLFRRVVELGGTLTGEHGIGLSKLRYLPLEQSEGLIALQRRLKLTFDPENLLNPGKIFPTTPLAHGPC